MTDQRQPAAESLRLELQEAVASYRHATQLLTQGASFIATADSVLLAYGFSQRDSGILLVASLMPVFMLVIYIEVMTHVAPFIYIGMILERELKLEEAPLLGTYASARLAPLFSVVDGVKELDKTALNSRTRWLKMRAPLMTLVVFACQFTLFVISVVVFHYRFM
jgi:hypothetical protein